MWVLCFTCTFISYQDNCFAVRADDADIAFQSIDNVIFQVHSANLTCSSEGFAPPDGTASPLAHEIIQLIETSDVLELIFQFMYPQRPPDLAAVDFQLLLNVAEAAEKYQVYCAMQICTMHMEHVLRYLSFSEYSSQEQIPLSSPSIWSHEFCNSARVHTTDGHISEASTHAIAQWSAWSLFAGLVHRVGKRNRLVTALFRRDAFYQRAHTYMMYSADSILRSMDQCSPIRIDL